MSQDQGSYGADDDDVVPLSPLNSIDGIPAGNARKKVPQRLHRLIDFDTNVKPDTPVQRTTDVFWGKFIDIDTSQVIDGKTYYEVQLNNGQFVQAYWPEQTKDHVWKETQLIQVVFNGTDYIIVTPADKKSSYLWWEANETLYPGGSAKGKLRYYDDAAETPGFKDNNCEVTVKDTEHRNFVLKGEKIQVRTNDLEYEAIGSYGLMRKARTITAIEVGAEQDVYVYTKGSKAKEPTPNSHPPTEQDVKVKVTVNWARTKRAEVGKDVFIQYFTDEEKWIFLGGSC